MWKLKLIKNFLLSLALSLFFALPVFAQEDSFVLEELQKTVLELNSKSNNSQTELEALKQNYDLELNSANNLKDNLTQSELESMSPFELLDLLEMTLDKAQKNYEEAAQSSLSLEKDLLNMKLELENSQKTLEELKKALLSNKDDTSYLVSELGELFEKIKKLNESIALLEKIRKRTRTVSYIELGIGIPCFIIGFLPIWTKEQQNIKNLFLGVGGTAITTGAATFIVTVRF